MCVTSTCHRDMRRTAGRSPKCSTDRCVRDSCVIRRPVGEVGYTGPTKLAFDSTQAREVGSAVGFNPMRTVTQVKVSISG